MYENTHVIIILIFIRHKKNVHIDIDKAHKIE